MAAFRRTGAKAAAQVGKTAAWAQFSVVGDGKLHGRARKPWPRAAMQGQFSDMTAMIER